MNAETFRAKGPADYLAQPARLGERDATRRSGPKARRIMELIKDRVGRGTVRGRGMERSGDGEVGRRRGRATERPTDGAVGRLWGEGEDDRRSGRATMEGEGGRPTERSGDYASRACHANGLNALKTN